MAKVFVLGSNSFGGASYIGSALSEGHEVVGVSRSAEANVAYLPYKWQDHKNYQFYQMDLNKDYVALQLLMERERPDYVINFAGQSMVAQSWDSPADWMQTNVVAITRLMEILRGADWLQHYIHFSTPEVYGNVLNELTEDQPFDPSTPYALSRAAGDQVVALWKKTYGLPVTITRAANIYGEGQQVYRIITRTILSCLTGSVFELHGGGVSERDFIHMDDVSTAISLILRCDLRGDDIKPSIYHIATGHLVSIRALVEQVCSMLGCNFSDIVVVGEERLGKDMCYRLNCDRARSLLDWKPSISLEKGLERCIEWVHTYKDCLLQLPQLYIHKA